MLKVRVIPCLLADGSALVKGRGFDSWRRVGHVMQAARVHEARQVDELIILDIAATREGRGPNLELAAALTKDCFMPVAIGGGISTVEQIRDLLRAGADKVVIGTAALENPRIVVEASDKFGAQCITVAVDVKHRTVWGRCGTVDTGRYPAEFARHMTEAGAGEIILNRIERDGTMEGYDLDLIRRVSGAVRIPVVAAGGCSGYPDMAEAISAGAHAVSAGALFQFTDATPKSAARYLAEHGFAARAA